MNPITGRLLVVDDEELNRDMLSRRLRRRGHNVDIAEDGRRALDAVARDRFDVVLLDVMMPEIDGLVVLKTLRDKHSITDLPVIMVTAKNQSEDIVEALQLGANDYITKPIDFAEAMARINTQLRLRRLSEAKDQFLRIASHDLKSPLAAILSTASILPQIAPVGSVMTEQFHGLLTRVHGRGREMQHIIEDFLDFQAFEDGHLQARFEENVDLNQLLSHIVENNGEYALRKAVVLGFEPAADLPPVRADQARISQIAQNLVGNAIKFSPRDAPVRVRTRVEAEAVRAEICDAGPGLTPEDQAKLFTKYARLSNKPTGGEKSSGLGLYICKQMIELHGGRIGACNNPDHGATFWFELPMSGRQSVD